MVRKVTARTTHPYQILCSERGAACMKRNPRRRTAGQGGDDSTRGRVTTHLLGTLISLVALLLFANFVRGSPPLSFFAAVVLAGFGYGLIRPTVSALLVDNFQGKGLGAISGAAMTIFSLSGVFGPYITGALFDATGSYRAGFLLVFAVVAAGGGCIAALGGKMRMEGKTEAGSR